MVEIIHYVNRKTEIVSSKLKQISRVVAQGSTGNLLLGKSRADQFEVDNFVALNMAVQYCHNIDLLMVKKN